MIRAILIIGLATLGFVAGQPTLAQVAEDNPYEAWVDYRDGNVTIAFDQTPVQIALSAIHAKTGFQIEIPPAAESEVVNLKLTRLPLEPAVHQVISSIGFQNFAVLYDEDGQPKRAVVLRARPPESSGVIPDLDSAAPNADLITAPLRAEEREKIQRDLERWNDLKKEERGRIEDRLKTLPASEEREQLVREYGRQVLGIRN